MIDEEWRAIDGFNLAYSVSAKGRVRSEARYVRHGVTTMRVRERIMKTRPDADGYLLVNLHLNGAQITAKVATLVAEAFIGPRPTGLDVCHDDGDNQNNKPSNLRYDTRVGNLADCVRHGTDHRGEKHPLAKLNDVAVRQIRVGGESDKSWAARFNVSPRQVAAVRRKQAWGHLL